MLLATLTAINHYHHLAWVAYFNFNISFKLPTKLPRWGGGVSESNDKTDFSSWLNLHFCQVKLSLIKYKTSCVWHSKSKFQSGVYSARKIYMVGWSGGWFLQEIIPLRGSILQVGTCQIFSWAENQRWRWVWQFIGLKKSTVFGQYHC